MTPPAAGGPYRSGRAGGADRPGLLGGLDVDVDLALEIEDDTGRCAAGRVSTSGIDTGRVVRWEVDRPDVALTALATGPAAEFGGVGRHARRALADTLVESGWRAQLAGPAGVVVEIGPRRRRWAAIATGSPHVHLSAGAARSLVLRSARGLSGVMVGMSVVAIGVLVAIVRRRSPRG